MKKQNIRFENSNQTKKLQIHLYEENSLALPLYVSMELPDYVMIGLNAQSNQLFLNVSELSVTESFIFQKILDGYYPEEIMVEFKISLREYNTIVDKIKALYFDHNKSSKGEHR